MYHKITIIFILIYLQGCISTGTDTVHVGNKVILAYKIKDENGYRIDESFMHSDFNNIEKNELFSFVAGNHEVIKGWDSVIIGCNADKIYTFIIPAEQAYGSEAIYHDIPANSNLILTFKIFEIKK